MKVLNFEDVVFFRVPIEWVVAGEEGSGIAIYDDRQGSGTLRPWTEEYAFDDEAGRDVAAGDVHNGRPSEALDERATLSYSIHESEALQLHRWIVAIRKDHHRLRIVTFTHTVDAKSESDDKTAWELSIINAAVRSALYSGVDVESQI